MKNQIITFINKYKLIFLGFIIFALFFWNRFLHIRSSKILPLNLSILNFFSLTYICLIFLFIIISLIISKNSNPLIGKIIDWLFIPLVAFNNLITNISFIKFYYEKTLNYILKKSQNPHEDAYIFFIFFWLLPRCILITVLFIDVFIFHQLHYKYYFIFFSFILFLNRYFKFLLKEKKEQLLNFYKPYIGSIDTDYVFGIHPSELEPDYDPDDPDEDEYCEKMYLPFDVFIEFQAKSIVYQDITRNINSIQTTLKLDDIFWEKYIGGKRPIFLGFGEKLPDNYTNIFGDKTPDNYYKADHFIYKKRKKYGENAVKEIMKLALLIEYHNKISNQDKKVKKLKILIYFNYFLSWLYILLISLPTLNIFELFYVLNHTWLFLEDPFSNLYLF